MQRVQLQMTDEQAAHLQRRSSATGKSVATVIRELIDDQRAADEKQRRIDIALAALKKPAFHSGLADFSENHDEYFVQAIEERIGRR
jgi:predicted DNA-binding protein